MKILDIMRPSPVIEGLGEGLKQLALMRLQQNQQNQLASVLKSQLPNASPEFLQNLAAQDPQLINKIIELQQQNSANQEFSNLMGDGAQLNFQGPAQPQFQGQPNMQQPPTGMAQPSIPGIQPNIQQPQEMPKKRPIAALDLDEYIRGDSKIQDLELRRNKFQSIINNPNVSSKTRDIAAGKLKDVNSSIDIRTKTLNKAYDHAVKRQENVNNETKGYVEKIYSSADYGKNSLDSLSRMTELIDTGNLTSTNYEQLRKGIHIPGLGNVVGNLIEALFGGVSPESQEFEALTSQLINGIKDVFGGNVAVKEVELFMKKLPSLSQSDEGKRRVIGMLENLAQASLIKEEALRGVIEENGGVRPGLDKLRTEVERRSRQRLKELSKEFKSRMQSIDVSEAKNRANRLRNVRNSGIAFSDNPLSVLLSN